MENNVVFIGRKGITNMKKHTKIFAVMMALALALAFTACKKEEPAPEPDSGQNPIMNFVGTYACDRASILVEATDETNGAKATVTWGSSAAEHSEWTMSGTYDADSHVFTYADCVKKNVVFKEDGSVESEEEVYKDGTGTMTFSEGTEGPYLEWKDDKENVADGMTFTFVKEGGQTGVANPWSDVDSAEAAAEGAGFDSFVIPAGEELSLGKIENVSYRCMDGMTEAVIEYPAAQVVVRKGDPKHEMAEHDISGDYNQYKNNWQITVGDYEVYCAGNREGDSTKTVWSSGEYDYAVLAKGLGGDEDFGLGEDDLNVLVNGTK